MGRAEAGAEAWAKPSGRLFDEEKPVSEGLEKVKFVIAGWLGDLGDQAFFVMQIGGGGVCGFLAALNAPKARWRDGRRDYFEHVTTSLELTGIAIASAWFIARVGRPGGPRSSKYFTVFLPGRRVMEIWITRLIFPVEVSPVQVVASAPPPARFTLRRSRLAQGDENSSHCGLDRAAANAISGGSRRE